MPVFKAFHISTGAELISIQSRHLIRYIVSMHIWISLLRGINVGGKNILPMKDLRSILEELNCENIKTYIQSGNCVYRHKESNPAKLSTRISKAIGHEIGFEPPVLSLPKTDLDRAVDANPYSKEATNANQVHFSFLFEPPSAPDIQALNDVKSATECFTCTDGVFYLFAPDGIGRSKLASKVETKVGVQMTTRNLRTVLKLQQMAETMEN